MINLISNLDAFLSDDNDLVSTIYAICIDGIHDIICIDAHAYR